MKGTLTLIPTPIDNESSLNKEAYDLLLKAHENADYLVVVEEHKEARRRWLRWELPREAIDEFILFNEHSTKEDLNDLVMKMNQGKHIVIMSDCGLPAFCDPGQELVYRCHQDGIKVSSTPFSNSVILALALSGLKHDEFYFAGFLPKENTDLDQKIKEILKKSITSIVMDTPYRLKKTLSKFQEQAATLGVKREIFLAVDLNKSTESLVLTNTQKLDQLELNKREFIMVIGSKA